MGPVPRYERAYCAETVDAVTFALHAAGIWRMCVRSPKVHGFRVIEEIRSLLVTAPTPDPIAADNGKWKEAP